MMRQRVAHRVAASRCSLATAPHSPASAAVMAARLIPPLHVPLHSDLTSKNITSTFVSCRRSSSRARRTWRQQEVTQHGARDTRYFRRPTTRVTSAARTSRSRVCWSATAAFTLVRLDDFTCSSACDSLARVTLWYARPSVKQSCEVGSVASHRRECETDKAKVAVELVAIEPR